MAVLEGDPAINRRTCQCCQVVQPVLFVWQQCNSFGNVVGSGKTVLIQSGLIEGALVGLPDDSPKNLHRSVAFRKNSLSLIQIIHKMKMFGKFRPSRNGGVQKVLIVANDCPIVHPNALKQVSRWSILFNSVVS